MTVRSILFITVIRLRPAIKVMKTNGIFLTTAIEIQKGDQGLIATMNANKDFTRGFPSPHNQRSLSQHIQTIVPANQKATATTNTQRTIMLVKVSLKAVAVAGKKNLTAVEAKIAVEKTPEATKPVYRMKIVNRDIIRRYHEQTPKNSCQIITLP